MVSGAFWISSCVLSAVYAVTIKGGRVVKLLLIMLIVFAVVSLVNLFAAERKDFGKAVNHTEIRFVVTVYGGGIAADNVGARNPRNIRDVIIAYAREVFVPAQFARG